MKKLNVKFFVYYKNNGKISKVKTLTQVRIFIDSSKIAEATLAGKWTIEQAKEEFKRNPMKFHTEGISAFDKDQLADLALIV